VTIMVALLIASFAFVIYEFSLLNHLFDWNLHETSISIFLLFPEDFVYGYVHLLCQYLSFKHSNL